MYAIHNLGISVFLGYPVEPKVTICSKFLHFQLDFELHYTIKFRK